MSSSFPTSKKLTYECKIELARRAAHEAMNVRLDLGVGLTEPISIYSICEKLGVIVRIVDVNMDGIYLRGSPPRILISSLRPLSRRVFSCAHELGHHIFGHGSTLEECKEDAELPQGTNPKEFLADAFAGHLLMPVLGIRSAFARRKVEPHNATPMTIWSVASEMGVSCDALTTQLTFAFKDISPGRRKQLSTAFPRIKRDSVLGAKRSAAFLIDAAFRASSLDIDVGQVVVAPESSISSDNCLSLMGHGPEGYAFIAKESGICELSIPSSHWNTTVRIAPKEYVGLTRYIHLERD